MNISSIILSTQMLALVCCFAADPEYQIIEIAPKAFKSPAYLGQMGINNAGEVSGSWYPVAGSPSEAFRFSADTAPMTQTIESLSDNGAWASSINSWGQIVGECWRNPGNVVSSFSYTPAIPPNNQPSTVVLPTLGGQEGSASDINNSGQTTGYGDIPGIGESHAYHFSPPATMLDLGTLPGGKNSTGICINERGDVGGYSEIDAVGNIHHAFVYSKWVQPGLQDIHPGDLPTPPAGGSYTFGINNDGDAVGFYFTASGTSGFISRYIQLPDPERISFQLPPLDGASYSRALAINEAGTVVGESTLPGGYRLNTQAVIWTKKGQARELGKLIPQTKNGDDPEWVLKSACAINELGQIAGYGTRNGNPCAFLLQPLKFYRQGDNQGDNNSEVPATFGRTGHKESTARTGCVLTSITNLLRTYKDFDSLTVAELDMWLDSNGNVYTNTNGIRQGEVARAIGMDKKIEFDSIEISDLPQDQIDKMITDAFREGYRVLLRLEQRKTPSGTVEPTDFEDGHTVMVAGRILVDGIPQWWIFDPGWRNPVPLENIQTLQGHISGFTTTSLDSVQVFRDFRVSKIQRYRNLRELADPSNDSNPELHIQGNCPIELLVTDPSGRRLGVDASTGTSFSEVPDATYSIEGDTISADGDDEGRDPYGSPRASIPAPMAGSYNVQVGGIADGPYSLNIMAVGPGGGVRRQAEAGVASAGSKKAFVATVPQPGEANLELTQAASLTSAHIGDMLTYQLKLKNLGPDTATSVSISNLASSGLMDSAESSVGNITKGGRVAKIDIGTLPKGATATATIRVRTTSAGFVSNTATAVAYEADLSPADNTNTHTALVDNIPFHTTPGAGSPSGNSFPPDGGTGSIDVTTSPDCQWSAYSNEEWITIDSGNNGSGNGVVAFSVAGNTGAENRSGTIVIGNQTLVVTQTATAMAPVITIHPDDSISHVGGTASFEVVVQGKGPFTYQWRFNGANLIAPNSATLRLTELTSKNSGTYSVVVSNQAGTTESRNANLCITSAAGSPITYGFAPRYPIPNAMTFNASLYDAGKYYCVGKNGALISSSDSKSWQMLDSSVAVHLNGIAKGNGIYVAVGDEGCVITSTDGIHWWQQASGTRESLRAVAFGAGKFVAVGTAGTIISSSNCVSWAHDDGKSLETWNGIAFGNSSFVVVGMGGIMKTSTNGVSWNTQPSGVSSDLRGIYFGGDKFVAMGSQNKVLVSPDAAKWNVATVVNIGTFPGNLLGGGFGDNIDFVVGETGIWLSYDAGVNWVVVPNFGRNLRSIAYGPDGYIAIGESSLYTSPDGITWTLVGSFVGQEVVGTHLCEMDGSYLAFTGWKLSKSINSLDWDHQPILSPPTHFNPNNLISGNGMLLSHGLGMFVGEGLFSSSDGINWSNIRPTNSGRTNFESLQCGLFAGGRFVYCGYSHATAPKEHLISSPDGVNWTKGNFQSADGYLWGLAYGNGVYVAVGDAGRIYTSTDAVNWTRRLSGITSRLEGVAFFNKKFFGVGQFSGVISSTNGIAWSFTNAPWSEAKDSLNSDNGTISATKNGLFVVTKAGSKYVSMDGTTWRIIEDFNDSSYSRGVQAIGNRIFATSGYHLSQGIPRPLIKGPKLRVSRSGETLDWGDVLDFGKTSTAASVKLEVNLENIGESDLRGLHCVVTGANSVDFKAISPILGKIVPGGKMSVLVKFTPSKSGGRGAKIDFVSNDPMTTRLWLIGTGVDKPDIDIRQPLSRKLVDNVSTRTFGTISLGSKSTKVFTITNTGNATLKKVSISTDGNHASDFIATAPALDVLAPGKSTSFKVTFKPLKKGYRNTAIRVKSNDPDENPFDIRVSGLGE